MPINIERFSRFRFPGLARGGCGWRCGAAGGVLVGCVSVCMFEGPGGLERRWSNVF
jgi:hypothetical protein